VIEPITHIRRDERGTAWIAETNTKVIELVLHLPVELDFVIVVVRQRSVDLRQRKMRVGRMDFLCVPSVRSVVHSHLDDFCVRLCDPGGSALIPPDVSNRLDH
jgi:hypothetical protein